MKNFKRALATIDLAALRHNLARAKTLAAGSQVMAVVKADAYGHGIMNCVPALAAADAFAVATIQEALELSWASAGKTIVVLEGFFEESELMPASEKGMELVLHAEWQLKVLEQSHLSFPQKVWLKVDTGMHRLGFAPADVESALARIAAMPHLTLQGVMSHLAYADDVSSTSVSQQLSVFEKISAETKSLANSAAICAWPDTHFDWVRPGIMLYGSSPVAHVSVSELGLRPVMRFTTPLISVRELKAGETVGYGDTFVCPEDMKVGVAAVGYGDGYPRHAGNGAKPAQVAVNGQVCELAGRVSMDMITIDLRNCENAQVGGELELWGETIQADDVAAAADTIAYELFCGLSSRVQFQYKDSDA